MTIPQDKYMGVLRRKVKIEWSSNFAYAIGLITSDGCLNKDRGRIQMSSKEMEMIDNFKTALAVTNHVTRHTRGGEIEKKYLLVSVGDRVFYEFLRSIGLSPAKSKTIQHVDIPDKYFADFLRGLYDGDGSFYTFWDTRWPNSFGFVTTFSSASLQFIKWLRERLQCLYGLKGHSHKGVGVHEIRYLKGDSRKLFHTMYYSDDLLYLKRKRDKIVAAMEFDANLHQRPGQAP